MIEPVAVEVQAKALGWVPLEDFRGDPDKWADAETFVEKGKHIMPILQKNNERLQGELASLKVQQDQTRAALVQAQEALADLQEHHTVQTQKAVDQARRELKAQIAHASENGDHMALAELTDQLSQMPTEAPKPKPVLLTPQPPPLPPEFVSWQSDNKWFGVDIEKTALANAYGQKLRAENSPLIGRPFWDAVSERVETVLGTPKDRPSDDKVAGSRPSASSGGHGAGKYSDLPADAKEACDADLREKVGENKRYKTNAEWRQRYAELYFKE